MPFFFLVWVFKSPEMWCGRRVLHFAIFFHSTPPHPLSFFPPVLHFAPGSRPLCDGSSDSGKRSTGIPGWHTGPTGAKKTWGVALTGPQRKGHVSQIIQCLCLLRFWQVDWLCLQRRPSDSRYQPLSALSATQTHTATAAADISARWVVPFASLLNVRKYQAVFNSILSFWSPSMTLFCFSYLSLPSFCLAVCLFFILHFQTELNRWSFQCNICKHITEKCFFLLPEHTVRNIRHVVDFK